MFKKDKIVFSTNPHTALSSFPQEALEDVVVVGCLGSVSDIQRLCSFPGLFEMVCSDGSVHAFLDSDEGVVVLHCDDGEENEAHALVAMLYVFLTSHAVVIFDTFFDPEWVRRLRLLSELRRCVHGAKGPPTLLTFCLEDSSVRFSHISTVLAEYRTMNDSNKRLFRLHDSSNQVISLSALAVWLSSAAGTRKTTLPSKIQAKKDLIEIAKSLLAASGSASLLSKPVARRLVVACNCGQRQVVLRDLTDSTAAPCCMDCNVALSASGSTSQWSLSVLPPGSSPGGPGFVDTSATSLLTFKHYSFGIEYECFAGHRFFLTDAMARVVLRLTQLDKLMTTDVPLYTRCLACKQQEAADSGPAQLMRLHVAALVPGQLVLDPILKFKLKSGQGHSFSFRVPCKPISICGLSYYVLRLPRCYAAPDNLGWVVQRDINSPFVAVLCAGWLT